MQNKAIDWTPISKLSRPALIGLVVGIALLLTGEEKTGMAVLLTAAGYFGVGYCLPDKRVEGSSGSQQE